MMWRRFGVAVVFVLGLESLVTAARACVSELLACTSEMRQGMSGIKNRSSLCGLMDDYLSCIWTSCNSTLSPCVLSGAKDVIDRALGDCDVQCESSESVYVDMCSPAGLVSSGSPLLLLLTTVCVWGLMYTRGWTH